MSHLNFLSNDFIGLEDSDDIFRLAVISLQLEYQKTCDGVWRWAKEAQPASTVVFIKLQSLTSQETGLIHLNQKQAAVYSPL